MDVIPNPTRPLLTRQQVAERWGVSPATVTRRVSNGQLVELQFGPRLRRFRLADIEAYEERTRRDD